MALTIDRELAVLLDHPAADAAELAAILQVTEQREQRAALRMTRVATLIAVVLCVQITAAVGRSSTVAAVVFALWGAPAVALGAALLGERIAGRRWG